MKRLFLIFVALVAALSVSANPLILLSGSPPAAGGAFTYHASGFSGDDRLERDGALTGIADGNAWTVSFWFKMTGSDSATQYFLFFGDQAVTNPFFVSRASDNSWTVNGKTTGFSTIFLLGSQTTFVASGATWHHFFASGNGTTFNLYIDGVNDKAIGSTEGSGNVPFTYAGTSPAADWSIGMATDGASPTNAKISELWFNNSYIAAPTAFRDSGHPADIGSDGSTGTGVTPKIYMHGTAAGFATNAGNGGNFTVKAGTLTDEDADKP